MMTPLPSTPLYSGFKLIVVGFGRVCVARVERG
jgi:hypothetical protein